MKYIRVNKVDAEPMTFGEFKAKFPKSGGELASERHDALARKRYVKPFKFFKFNRARKATAK